MDNREVPPSSERPRGSEEGQRLKEELASEVNGYTSGLEKLESMVLEEGVVKGPPSSFPSASQLMSEQTKASLPYTPLTSKEIRNKANRIRDNIKEAERSQSSSAGIGTTVKNRKIFEEKSRCLKLANHNIKTAFQLISKEQEKANKWIDSADYYVQAAMAYGRGDQAEGRRLEAEIGKK